MVIRPKKTFALSFKNELKYILIIKSKGHFHLSKEENLNK
jgi:hypothetical protein